MDNGKLFRAVEDLQNCIRVAKAATEVQLEAWKKSREADQAERDAYLAVDAARDALVNLAIVG